MPSNAVEVNIHEIVEELQSILVDVTLDGFLGERLCPLKILYGDLGSLLENNQPVDVPSVETKATAPVVN